MRSFDVFVSLKFKFHVNKSTSNIIGIQEDNDGNKTDFKKNLNYICLENLQVLVEEVDVGCDSGKSCRQASFATKSGSEGGNTNLKIEKNKVRIKLFSQGVEERDLP